MITIENLDNTYDHGVSPTNNDYSPNRSQKTTSKNEEDKFVKFTRKYFMELLNKPTFLSPEFYPTTS